MPNFTHKLSRITYHLHVNKISEREAKQQLRELLIKRLSDEDILLQNIDGNKSTTPLGDAIVTKMGISCLNDEELSLVVAKVMYPEYKWRPWGGVAISDNDGMEFLYTDTDCAWDMAVWLSERHSSGRDWLQTLLKSDNPQHSLALAILEIGGSDD